MPPRQDGPFRVVLTGGPGGGKTTAADLFRRELGDAVVVVPEAATMLYCGGFPRPVDGPAAESVQRAIYHVQLNLEEIQASLHPDRVLLCDRGTVDGGAFWPGPADEFFADVGSTLATELGRYDAVIHFESAAVGGIDFGSDNPVRTESMAEAAVLDRELRTLWSGHPSVTVVPHSASFFEKMAAGLAVLESVVAQASH